MAFNLGLEECNIVPQGDYMDMELDNFIFEDMRDGAISRLDSIVRSVDKFNSSEQITILNFLANDSTIRDIIGNDPDTYIDRLKKYNDHIYESNEVFGPVVGYALVAYLNKLKPMLTKLKSYRGIRPTNTCKNRGTKDVRIIPPKVLSTTMQNNMKFLNHLISGLNNLDKFDINSLYPYYESIGLKIPPKHSGFLLGGSLIELLGILISVGSSTAALWAAFTCGLGIGGAIFTALVGQVVFGGGFAVIGNAAGTMVKNRDSSTAAEKGWNDSAIKRAVNESDNLYEMFKNMDNLYNQQYKNMKKQYPDKFKAIKQAYKTVYTSTRGCVKSLLVLCDVIYAPNVTVVVM